MIVFRILEQHWEIPRAVFGNETTVMLWRRISGCSRFRIASASSESELDGIATVATNWYSVEYAGDAQWSPSNMVFTGLFAALPVPIPSFFQPLGGIARCSRASYEATIWLCDLEFDEKWKQQIVSYAFGGGAFGNETDWIIGGIRRALNLYKRADLDVAIESYGSSNQNIRQLVNQTHN